MRRIVLILGLIGAMGVSAALRTSVDALRIADDFAAKNAGGLTAKRAKCISDPAKHSGSVSDLAVADSSAAYIAVNAYGGFVLVGADDRMPEVLGYSDACSFEPGNMSPSLRYWLDCYAEELASLNLSGVTGHTAQRFYSPGGLTAVSPLCPSQWNQGEPYNNLAPVYNDVGKRCVTGCVATAMAQIMYYYRYPEHGTGSNSYLWVCSNPVGKSATLSADFGQATYRWDKMLDIYNEYGYNTEQADAIATLMYHCGVSVYMGYGTTSGAYTEDVPIALQTYFGYDGNYQRIRKIMYPADSLSAIIAAELEAQRPVLVSGRNDKGGHAFVCDGYDNKGYFHINWGWGGKNDGYYLLTALNPEGKQGTGGTTEGYNKSTTFFIGLQPAKSGTPKAIPQMATTTFSVSSESFARSSSFSVSIAKLENHGMNNFNGSYGVALYDEDETQLVTVLKQVDNYSLSAGYYRTTAATLSGIKIPSSVPAGTYHLCAVYKNADYGWMRMLCTEDDYYRTLELTDTRVTLYPNDAPAELTLTAPIAFPEGTNADSVPKTGLPLAFSVKNSGGTFRGDISARIYKGAFSKGQYEIADSLLIRRNQSLSSALQQQFDMNLLLNTQYKMRLCWRADANDSWHNFEPAEYAELSFKLVDLDYHLSLTDTIRFDRNDSVPRSNANLYYSILNTGAPFDGQLQLSFYQEPFSRGKSDIQNIHIGTNETLEGAFSGPLDQEPGTYTVVLRYRDSESEWQEFIDINLNNIGSIVATIYDDQPLPPVPTGMEHTYGPLIAEPQLLMRFGAYDLYIVPVREGEKIIYRKVFKPVQ